MSGRAFEYDNAVRQLRLNHWAGLNIATMTHRLPSVHNHFSTDPPIDEQMARAAKHLPTLTPVAEDLGVIMAWGKPHGLPRLRGRGCGGRDRLAVAADHP